MDECLEGAVSNVTDCRGNDAMRQTRRTDLHVQILICFFWETYCFATMRLDSHQAGYRKRSAPRYLGTNLAQCPLVGTFNESRPAIKANEVRVRVACFVMTKR
jgi:hypothetical protein